MKPAEFKLWRQKMGVSQAGAAKSLGLTVQAVQNYERGVRAGLGTPVRIPQTVALACAALAAGLKPWGEQTCPS